MTRSYEHHERGKITVYQGWNRSFSPPPEFVALVQDEDLVDMLALSSPVDLDGVHAYITDRPCCKFLGVWQQVNLGELNDS